MKTWVGVLFAAFLATLGHAADAQSQIDLSQIKDVARAKAEEGLELFGEEKWAEAYERFRVAEDLFHAPTLGLYMGHCKRRLGQLIASRALYRSVATEELSESSAPAFKKAVEEAARLADEVDQDIPRISIEVTGVPMARVTVDGKPVELAPAELELDPGTHHIAAVAAGADVHEQDVELAPGAREHVAIELEAVVVPSPTPTPPTPLPPPLRPPPPPESGSIVPAFIAYGIGAAGLLTGAIAGGIALTRINAIKAECDGDVCPDRLIEQADQAQVAATVANVGFVVGGVGAIVGTVLVFVRPNAESAAHQQITLGVGMARAQLEVRF